MARLAAPLSSGGSGEAWESQLRLGAPALDSDWEACLGGWAELGESELRKRRNPKWQYRRASDH